MGFLISSPWTSSRLNVSLPWLKPAGAGFKAMGFVLDALVYQPVPHCPRNTAIPGRAVLPETQRRTCDERPSPGLTPDLSRSTGRGDSRYSRLRNSVDEISIRYSDSGTPSHSDFRAAG